jgi:membrane-associated protease RseP (regulator of RpoE activity)
MKNPSIYALAGLLLAGTAAWAQKQPTPAPKQVVREKIVVVDKDGKEHVWDSEGTPVRRGFLGVGLTELSPELRAHFGAPEDAGVMVSSVEDGSPADKAGVKVGDIIASLDGKDVKSSWDIRSQIRELKDGEQVPITVYRDGKAQNLSAAIAMRERPELDMAPFLFRRGTGGGDGEHQPMILELDREQLRNLPRGQGAPGERDVLLRRGMRSPREAELEKRLKELEKRLADLEKLLEKK